MSITHVHGHRPVYSRFSHYMEPAFVKPEHVALHVRQQIDVHKLDFDTIVGTGLSGALVVPYVAESLELFWAIVRKEGESSHSSIRVEGRIGRRWLFLDDLVERGDTYRRVVDAVNGVLRNCTPASEHVGVLTYAYPFPNDSYLARLQYGVVTPVPIPGNSGE